LTNPAELLDGSLDSEQIGPWTLWQGNLNAELMVIGQDWGDVGYFLNHRGRDGLGNPTNERLARLLSELGVEIKPPGTPDCRQIAFFTNAILCLKEGGLGGHVRDVWFTNCASFLRRQIEIVSPQVIALLGKRAYSAVLSVYGIRPVSFRAAVEDQKGVQLPNGSIAFAVYHCGARVALTHRREIEQVRDWRRIGLKLGVS
jgi:DNA polymerase